MTAAGVAPADTAAAAAALGTSGAMHGVQFCAASPPTVTYAVCSLAGLKLDFTLGEVRRYKKQLGAEGKGRVGLQSDR